MVRARHFLRPLTVTTTSLRRTATQLTQAIREKAIRENHREKAIREKHRENHRENHPCPPPHPTTPPPHTALPRPHGVALSTPMRRAAAAPRPLRLLQQQQQQQQQQHRPQPGLPMLASGHSIVNTITY